MRVYELRHVHLGDWKFLGVHDSYEHAAMAADRARGRPGFCDAPWNFHIDMFHVGWDYWRDGFGSTLDDDRGEGAGSDVPGADLEQSHFVSALWTLWHEDRNEVERTVGYYRSKRAAIAARRRASARPGFKESRRSFLIGTTQINGDGWEDGYVTMWVPE